MESWLPDPLADRSLVLDGRVAADASDAERALIALDASTREGEPHRLEVLARLLLRAEAVGSSRVEGLVVSPRKLALATHDPALDPTGRALEVVGNIRALERRSSGRRSPAPSPSRALRKDSAAWALIEVLPAAPLVTGRTATELTGRSDRAIDQAIGQLVEAGILKQIGGRIRYRLFEAVGVCDLVTEAERALASPAGDTRQSPPVRPVPARPRT